MKLVAAVLAAFAFLAFGWLFLGMLLYWVAYLALKSGHAGRMMSIFHMFLVWILSPGFGGFLATYVPPRLGIFKSLEGNNIAISFMSCALTLGLLLGTVLALFLWQQGSGLGLVFAMACQLAAILIGAKIGKKLLPLRDQAEYA